MNTKDSPVLVPRIFSLRGESVMLDLAALFGVTTGNFNKAIQRNAHRFPSDFAFLLTGKEFANLMFQIGLSRRTAAI
jgi:hypothetical protein